MVPEMPVARFDSTPTVDLPGEGWILVLGYEDKLSATTGVPA